MRAVDYLTHCGEAVASREFSIGEADENAVGKARSRQASLRSVRMSAAVAHPTPV